VLLCSYHGLLLSSLVPNLLPLLIVIITIMHPKQILLSCQLETPSNIGSGFFSHMKGNDVYSVPHFGDLRLISFSYKRSCTNAFMLLGTRD
jgi:hypothetical protein